MASTVTPSAIMPSAMVAMHPPGLGVLDVYGARGRRFLERAGLWTPSDRRLGVGQDHPDLASPGHQRWHYCHRCHRCLPVRCTRTERAPLR
jgi:hypothetical protein